MKFFNLDLHVSVIQDIKQILEPLGHTVDNWSISGHSWVFGKEADKVDRSKDIDLRAAMLTNPLTDFGDRFQAVATDLLEGNHITQAEPEDPGLYREPTDNDEDPTQDF